MEDSSTSPEKQLTKAQLKNLKKKEKRKAAKFAGEDELKEAPPAEAEEAPEVPAEEAGAPGGGGKKGKGKKGGTAIGKKILAMKQKQKEEEEKRKREEEERLKKEEEERLKQEEAERIKREQEEKRIKEAKDEYQRKKEAGEILTDAQKKRKEKDEIMKQQILATLELEQQGTEDTSDRPFIIKKQRKHKKHQEDKKTEEQPAEAKAEENEGKGTEAPVEAEKEQKQAEPAGADKLEKDQKQEEKKEEPKKKTEDKEWDDEDWEAEESKVVQVRDEEEDESDEADSRPVVKRGGGAKAAGAGKSEKQPVKHEFIARPRAPLREKPGAGGKRALRAPIICIMGHVDTGKTKILDKIRRTNVQEGEAGGITQQIGATFFPKDALQEKIGAITKDLKLTLDIPGLIVIDTPGHESFTNLRSRGSSLCDMAILVIDIMHGIENQTKESIELLQQRKTPFLVALNKIDRIYDWQANPFMPTRHTLKKQHRHSLDQFEELSQKTITALAVEQSLNAALYWNNSDPIDTVSLVPTSAITGEGIPDLLGMVAKFTQSQLKKKVSIRSQFRCTVLEVKDIEGHGTTIDVILVSGTIKIGQYIVLNSFGDQPIATKVRALLTPHPLKEMRVKGDYQHHKQVDGTMGVKISAPGLEDALAGSELFATSDEAEIDELMDRVSSDVAEIFKKFVNKTKPGVCVQASTLGSLEALLQFLKNHKIPVRSIGIGTIHKKHVLNAVTAIETMYKEYATILAFDVKTSAEAEEFAKQQGIKIFSAPIIYHLEEAYTKYVEECIKERKGSEGKKAVFPCALEIVDVFVMKKPIVLGVQVLDGVIKVGTPLCVPDKANLRIGVVESIEKNHKPLKAARAKDGAIAVKIVGEDQVQVGRHFTKASQLVSFMTRDSIDALKNYFKDEMEKDDWRLVIKLKKVFEII